MMILAEVSSGRSELRERLARERGKAGVAGGRDRLDRRGAALARRRERGGAHRRDDLRIGRLHRLDRVAGIDRPLERLGRDDLGDVGNLHHVEQRRHARQHVLRIGARGGHESPHSRPPGRRAARRAVRRGHARRARRRRRELSRRRRAWRRRPRRPPRCCPATSTSTGAPSCSAAVSARAVMSPKWPFATSAKKKRRHVRSLPASSRSLATSSATRLDLDARLAAARLGGLQHLQARARRRRRNRPASSRRSASSSPS